MSLAASLALSSGMTQAQNADPALQAVEAINYDDQRSADAARPQDPLPAVNHAVDRTVGSAIEALQQTSSESNSLRDTQDRTDLLARKSLSRWRHRSAEPISADPNSAGPSLIPMFPDTAGLQSAPQTPRSPPEMQPGESSLSSDWAETTAPTQDRSLHALRARRQAETNQRARRQQTALSRACSRDVFHYDGYGHDSVRHPSRRPPLRSHSREQPAE